MGSPIATAIGRVVPFYVGAWASNKGYAKLDSVLYEGSTYIALRTVPVNTPPPNDIYWQMTAAKGDTGGIGTVNVQAYASASAYASGTVDGDDPSAMNFNFTFGLPKGDTGDPGGIATASASASQLGPLDVPTVEVTMTGPSDAAALFFQFGIPGAEGAVSLVDGIQPVSGNVPLYGVRYGATQNLTDEQKLLARTNIGAQASGNYIVDPNASTNQYLYFNNEGNWVGKNINEVPSGSSSDVNKYLRKTASGMIWASVQALPAGGAEGMPLVKNSVDDYDVGWGSTISSAEIDVIINS